MWARLCERGCVSVARVRECERGRVSGRGCVSVWARVREFECGRGCASVSVGEGV